MAGLEGLTLDRYELEELTGRGGMADVYRAFDPRFERTVAVKVFKRDDEDLLRRFIREARLMASLSHPHLMPIYDTGASFVEGATYYYIVMPFMTGGSLRALIRRGPLPPSLACRYLRDIADALDYIHERGIIHRDIKSSNVLLDEDGIAYLADFGIAHMESDATQSTSTGSVLGTVDYIAPELFESNQRANESSDLYSFGVLAFEMVTGRLPFSGESQIAVAAMHVNKQPPLPRSLVPSLPLPAERVLLRGLEKRPDQRYGSATEFADAFCYSISSRATAEMAAADPWATLGMQPTQSTSATHNQDDRLVLPPAAPAPLAYGNQQAPVTPNPYPQYAQNPQTGYQNGYQTGYPLPPQQQGLTPEERGARARVRIVTVLALITLLIITIPIVYLSFHPLGGTTPSTTPTAANGTTPTPTTTTGATVTPTPNLTATAQVYASATAQAQAHATATSIAGATATANAQASATAGVVQTATTGTPLYSDALTDPNNAATQAAQWDQNGNCAFKSDGYHVTVNNDVFGAGQFKGCHEAAHQYQNMSISVDMDLISGHSGGVFFRLGTNPQTLGAYSGYLFELDNTGRYKISSSSNFSTGSGNTILQDWTTSTAIKVGSTQKNTMLVIANNSTLRFYVNGKFLTSVTDTTFTSGGVGFLITTSNNGANGDAVYSNLKIYGNPPA